MVFGCQRSDLLRSGRIQHDGDRRGYLVPRPSFHLGISTAFAGPPGALWLACLRLSRAAVALPLDDLNPSDAVFGGDTDENLPP